MKKVIIYTDGACSGNPGKGGYAAILKYKQIEKEICGAEDETTNNRMELMAVIVGLEALNRPCDVEVISDSKYVTDAFTQHWIDGWLKRGWKNSNKEPVKNIDLWQRLDELTQQHEIRWLWVKGHNGHPENERCDALARGEVAKIKEEKIADKA